VTRRALLALAVAVGLVVCAVAATARADTFAVLESAPSALPSADAPNAPGAIVLPPSLSTPPAQPEQLSRDRLEELWKGAGAAYGIPWLGRRDRLDAVHALDLGALGGRRQR
jgi:hypothetical protein